MGRGNRGKKKTKNIAVMDLFEEDKNKSSEGLGGFSYSQCVTNTKKEKRKKKQDSEINIDSDKKSNNESDLNDFNESFIEAPPKIDFFDKNDTELELFEKRMLVDMFVNRYWNRICVCEPIEDIIIENENDNDSDEYFNDDF